MQSFVTAHGSTRVWTTVRTYFVALLAVTVCAALATNRAEAQLFAYAGGGATVPMGDFGGYARTGWMGIVGAGLPVGHQGFYAGAEVMYGSNAHKELAGDKTNLPGALVWAEFRAGDEKKPGPYLVGLLGMLDHQFKSKQFPDLEESEWKTLFGLGAGVDIPFGGNSLFIEARYVSRGTTNFAPVLAGLTFPLGKRK